MKSGASWPINVGGNSVRVLFVHPSPAFGGASKSLIELYRFLCAHGVVGTVLTPEGSAERAFRSSGFKVLTVRGLSQFDNTCYGFYRSHRWLILLRELFLLPFSLLAVWRLRREKFDLVHLNEVTLLPLGLMIKWLLGVPLVVHVRSLQRAPDAGMRSRLINSLLRRYADAVVPIDHTVARTLGPDLPLCIVHNGLLIDILPKRVEDSVDKVVKVGFLGVLIPLKGVFELVEAMVVLKSRGVRIQCLIAGENVRQLSGFKAWLLKKFGFARDVRAELEALIRRESLEKQVRLLGFVKDVRTIYPQLDILCFPSHLDAAGRPVFEAAFYSVPSVVAVANPLPDAVLHEVTGLAVPRPDPLLIADALQRLAGNPALRQKLGQQARDWAEENFSIKVNAERMLDLYRQILCCRRGH